MKKYIFAMVVILILVGAYFAYQHVTAIIIYIMTPNWINIFSMTIFILGAGYAIIERNLIIGGVAIIASVILPWAKSWFILYWPWIKECWLWKMRH